MMAWMPKLAGGANYLAWAGLAGSIFGLTYLNHKITDMEKNKDEYIAKGTTYLSPVVQERIS